MNQLYQQLNQRTDLSQNNLATLFKNASNPEQLLMNMAKTNPQISSIINMINANGGDAKSLFYAKAKQMGVDPESILKQLR